jgi:O-antigen/teichoic acid export membrane protein
MSRTSRAIKGTLTSFLQYGLQIVLQALLAPLVLRVAGQETLGAYAILLQAIGFISLVDFGFAAAGNRYLAQACGFDDGGLRLRQVMSTMRTYTIFIHLVTSSLCILLSIWIGPLLSLSPAIRSEAQTALYLMAAWVMLRTPVVIYGVSLVGTQNLAAANLISILGNIVRLSLSLCLVALGMGLVGLMAANILAEALALTLHAWVFHRRFPGIRLVWGFPDPNLFKEMFNFGTKAFLLMIAGRLIFQSDNLVAGYLYGAVAASIYYTTQMPAFFLSQLVNRLTDNSGPAINELYARGITESLRSAFLRLHRYNWILAIPAGLGLFFLGKPMIILWVGPAQFGGDWMVAALALFVVIFSIVNINKTLIIASGQIGILSIFALVEGVVNLVLSLILGHYLGLAGIIWATLIANIPTSLYLLGRSQHLLKVTIGEYSREVLKPLLIPLSMGIATFLIMKEIILVNAWGPFVLIAFIFLLIYSVLSYRLSIDRTERLLLNNILLGFSRGINPLKVTGQ